MFNLFKKRACRHPLYSQDIINVTVRYTEKRPAVVSRTINIRSLCDKCGGIIEKESVGTLYYPSEHAVPFFTDYESI